MSLCQQSSIEQRGVDEISLFIREISGWGNHLFFFVTKAYQVPEASIPSNGKYNHYSRGLANCIF